MQSFLDMLDEFVRNGHGRNRWTPSAPTLLVRLSAVVPGHLSSPLVRRWITCSTCRSPGKPLAKPGRRRVFCTPISRQVAHVGCPCRLPFAASPTGRACRLARLNRPLLVGLVVPVLAGRRSRNCPSQARPFAVPHAVHRQNPHHVELPLGQAGDGVALGRSPL